MRSRRRGMFNNCKKGGLNIMKRFNYTGTCIPERHYMADTSKKIEKIIEMVDYGGYFTINRPRQYGKTTTIALLEKRLKEKYDLISISFEGNGNKIFEEEELFCESIISIFAEGTINKESQLKKIIIEENKKYNNLKQVSECISRIIEKS